MKGKYYICENCSDKCIIRVRHSKKVTGRLSGCPAGKVSEFTPIDEKSISKVSSDLFPVAHCDYCTKYFVNMEDFLEHVAEHSAKDENAKHNMLVYLSAGF